MLKLFETGRDYNRKFNAVDDKNNFVGFDLNDDCCAHGGWFIAPEIVKTEPERPATYDVSGYNFDLNFFQEATGPEEWDEFRAVVIRLVSDGKPDLYLHLFNCHNGYYSKGFTMSLGGITKDISV